MQRIIFTWVFILIAGYAGAQVKQEQKYKGNYGDGNDRTEYFFEIQKVNYPTGGVCEGERVDMSIQVESVFAYTYAWKKEGNASTVLSDSIGFAIEHSILSDRGKYYCEVTDIKTGKTLRSESVELKIRKIPVVRINNYVYPKTICFGDTITLDARNTEIDKEAGDVYTYYWTGTAIIGGLTDFSTKALPKTDSKYGLTVSNSGCVSSDVVEVKVNRPEIDLPDFIYKTQGDRLELSVNASDTAVVSWKAGGTLYDNVNPLVIDPVDANIDIKVTLNDGGCYAGDSTKVYVRRGISFEGGINDGFERADHQVFIKEVKEPGLICENTELATLEVIYEGTLAYDFEWKKVGSDEVLGDVATLNFRDVQLKDRGFYFCRLIDRKSGKVKNSDTVELKVKKRPNVIIGSPQSPKLLCFGDTITLNATATEADKEAGDTYKYAWLGEAIIGNANSAVIRVAPKTNTTYKVTVHNGDCWATAEVEIIVYRPVIDIPDYVYISEGNTLELNVDVPASAKLIWNADGNIFEDINPFIYPEITKSMDVVVKMINEGCPAEDRCKVYVKRGRGYRGGVQDGFDMTCVPPSIVRQPEGVALCGVTDAIVEVIAEGTNLGFYWQRYSSAADSFQSYVPPLISDVDGLGTNILSFKPQLKPDDNGIYRCVVANECGTVITDSVLLSVGGTPVIKNGLRREWAQCAGTEDSVFLAVKAIDPLGKEWSKDPFEGLHYTWFVNGKQETGANRDQIDTLAWPHKGETVYRVDIANECGTTTDSVRIPVLTGADIIEPLADLITCVGGDLVFEVAVKGGGAMEYALMKGPKSSPSEIIKLNTGKYVMRNVQVKDEGEYYWVVTNGCGGDESSVFYVAVNEQMDFTNRTKDTLLCANENLDLEVEVNDHASALTYTWYRNGRPTGVSSARYPIRYANASDAGLYTCKVSNGCPAKESAPIVVTIKEIPRITTQPYLKSSYCEGDTVALSAVIANPNTVDSIRWYYNNAALSNIDGKITGATTATLSLKGLKSAWAGTYHVQLFSSCGGIRSNIVTLKIDLAPSFIRDLSGYNLDLCDGDNVTFEVEASGVTPISYKWTYEGTVVKQGFEPSLILKNVSPDTAGKYCVAVENRCGVKVSCTELKVNRPDTFRFVSNSLTGLICAGDNMGVTGILKGSDTVTQYSLYRYPDELLTVIHGRDVVPPMGFIEFKGLMGGSYYVVGENKKGCKFRMPGEVKVTESPQPDKYNTVVLKHICGDMQQAVIALDSSERNTAMEYSLMQAEGARWIPYLDKKRGTGDTLKWLQIPEGTYKITAKNTTTGCSRDMNGEVEIAVHTLPLQYALIAKGGDSTYCAGSKSDVILTLSGAEANVTYTLHRKDNADPVSSVSVGTPAIAPVWNNINAGTYYISAKNQWGCKNGMGQQAVVALTPPKQTTISGGTVYCKEQKGTGEVVINETQKGVLYKLYRENPQSVFFDTLGTGASITLNVPLEDKSYYVIAEDTTSEHCRTRLTGTAVFKMSRLAINCIPGEYTIGSGGTQQLNATVSGENGDYVLDWKPLEWLEPLSLATPKTPVTKPLTHRTDYIVRVTDATTCSDSAVVSVLVTSTDFFEASIRRSDRVTAIGDTLRACKGCDIELYAWVDGGSGIYDYRWRDESGNKGTGQYLTGYTRPAEGFLWLEVESDGLIARDSVWVKLYDAPAIQVLLTDGVMCAQDGVPVKLALNGSQKNISYILSYSSDNTRYNEIDTIAGTGDKVEFIVANAYNREGFYKVRAENIFADITCEIWMNGMAEIKKGVRQFNISGDKTYCEGINDIDTIRMDNSQLGITYTLYRKPSERKALQSGKDNKPIEFTGRFGSGEYFVLGSNGVCADTMSGRVTILRNLLPKELNLPEAGGYCGNCPEQITIDPAEAEVDYILWRKNIGVGNTKVETISGTGLIAFGKYCDHGEYYVVAKNQISQCERTFTDRIKIGVTPVDVNIEGEGKYCDSETAYTKGFHITDPQDGIDYRLFTDTDSLYVGTFDSVALNGLYYTKPLQAGTYQVIASIGTTDGCSYKLSKKLTVIKYALPANNNVIAPWSVCQGEGSLKMGVTTSDGYSYTLYYDNGTNTVSKGTQAGTGGDVFFGSFSDLGKYHVTVESNASACQWRILQEYKVDKPLNVFNITGDELYCLADGGVVIGVDSTEKDVKYVLQRWDTLNYVYKDVDELTGKGLPVAFRGYFNDGKYKVKAVRGCEKDMNGILDVRSKEMPSKFTAIELTGNGCQDSTIVISLKKTEQGVLYTLYFNGAPAGTPILSDGADTAWYIARAGLGTYQITADKENCLVTMPRTIEIGRCPFVNELFGDTLLCANQRGELWMEAGRWDKGAVYVLYNTAGDSITKGAERSGDGKLYFTGIPAGEYYAVAIRGNCVIPGDDIHTIKGVPVPLLPVDFWTVTNCVLSGEGEIIVKGMADSVRYVMTNSAGMELFNYKGAQTDTAFRNMDFERYCIYGINDRNNCKSDILCEEIREGVSEDILTGDFYYCGDETGARLHLSASGRNMLYKIKNQTGEVIEQLSSGTTDFIKEYKEGNYIFRKERTGFMGGCFAEEPFAITRYNNPAVNVKIGISGDGTLCANGEYRVTLQTTEAEVRYILIKDAGAAAEVYLDTLMGDGNLLQFAKPVNDIGLYSIYAEPAGGLCGNFVDTTFRVQARPRAISLTSCDYCVVPGETDSCSMSVSGLASGVIYRLFDRTSADTIDFAYGPGKADYKPCKAGAYYVLAEDKASGCRDTVAKALINARSKPNNYMLDEICDTIGTVRTLNGSDGDSVNYYLYRDGVQVAGPFAGTGQNIDMGSYRIPGTYKILAESKYGCEVWMSDSATIYSKPNDYELEQSGHYCEESTTGVTIRYGGSDAGWYYFLKKGMWNTDTLAGNGMPLEWNTIAGNRILSQGTYELYRMNACGKTLQASIEVRSNPLPQAFRLSGSDGAVCEGGAGLDIVISGSQAGVSYQLMFVKEGSEVERNKIPGTGYPVSFTDLTESGQYIVYGVMDSTGCRTKMGERMFWPGSVPDILGITGDDICLGNGVSSNMTICLDASAPQNGVNYYLNLSRGMAEPPVDTLHMENPAVCFKMQHEAGCYYVTAEDVASGCKSTMLGLYCAGDAPKDHNLVKTLDTVRLCRGNEYCIKIDGSDVGNKYCLLRNGVEYGAPVAGSGLELTVGCVGEPGVYRVKALAGDGCESLVYADSIVVIVNELPLIDINKEYVFCSGAVQQIGVNSSEASCEYKLYSPAKILLDTRLGNSDKSGFMFDGTYGDAGYYVIEAVSPDCPATDSVLFKVNKLPLKFRLSGTNDTYICFGTGTMVAIDSSETGVEYILYHKAAGGVEKQIARKYGTGRALDLGNATDPGTYYVQAVNITTGCEIRMDDLELKTAPLIDIYNLQGIKTGYCYNDPSKGSIRLENSKAGLFYQLLRDSVAYGTEKTGTGLKLEWNGLEGTACTNRPGICDTGYIYQVTARDAATGCIAWMNGRIGIVEESDVRINMLVPQKDTTVCEGKEITLRVEAVGCNLNYQWKKGKVIVKDTAENFLTMPVVAAADFGTYLCEVSNNCSSEPTGSVRLKVRGALKYLKRMENMSVCAGSDISLTGYIQNGTEHEWFRLGDEDELLSVDSWCTLYGVTEEDAGTYVYRSKNDCGVLADTVVLRVDSRSVAGDITFRTDTLCVGSPYSLNVVSGDSIKWYRGNNDTGIKGNDFILDKVTVEDDGLYRVNIFNACGMTGADVARLYVDEVIRKVAVHPGGAVCEGDMVDLYVRIQPEQRITYMWTCNGDTIAGANTNVLKAGPVTAAAGTYKYMVKFENSCNFGQDDIELSVSDRIEYEDPVAELFMCNGPGVTRDTFIYIKHKSPVKASYQWYWRETETGNPVKLEGEVYDTLRLEVSTQTRGYYFCKIGEVCNPATTKSSLVKIDTVPVLLSNLPENDVICEKTPYSLTVTANGGDLNYEWGCRLRNGTVETYFYDTVAMRSQSIFDFGNIGVEYDSCKIWCRVYNGCGEITTDTLLLRVNALPKLSITPRDSTICQFSSAQVILRQTAGIRPWTYRYGLDVENEQERTCNTVNDTLYLSDEGTWKFWGLTDGQCAVSGLVDSIKIQVTQVPKITVTNILARDTVCMGGEVQYRLSVEDGTGPFEITMFNKLGQPADELGMLWPYVLTERSEILSFLAVADGEYYIGQVIDRSAVAGACPVYTEGKIKVVIDEPVPVSFRTLSDNHLGACRPVDLDTLLMPQPSGGAYIVNGVMSTTICQLQVGCDTVRYIVESSVGCISERTVLLYADSLPSARMLLPRNVCTGADAGLEIPLNGNGYKFLLTRTRVDRNGGNTVESVPVRSVSDSYKERLVFLPSDSCVIYKLSGLEDRHGCTSAQVLQDSVYVRSYPELEIFTRYPDQEGQMWSSSATTLNITKGDSVAVRASLVKGVQPWTLRVKTMNGLQLLSDVSYNGLIHSDTILRIGDNKHYYFSAADAYCTTRKEIVRTVNYADTGYIRVAALLEGPYDATANAMKVGKKFKVPLLEGMNKFPDVGNRTIIDWVEISLRRGTTAEKAAQSPSGQMYTVKCLLLSDGTVVDAQGRNQLIIPYIVKSPAEKYYVLIRHRNHLGVMSASAYELGRTKQAAPLIDFRMGNIYINGGTAADHMSQVYTSGGWALSAGEFDQNALTSMYDVNGVALNKNDEVSYSIYDINFDGKIDWAGTKGTTKLDWSIVWKNKDKHCEIKW